jgi:hypothetical protein
MEVTVVSVCESAEGDAAAAPRLERENEQNGAQDQPYPWSPLGFPFGTESSDEDADPEPADAAFASGGAM